MTKLTKYLLIVLCFLVVVTSVLYANIYLTTTKSTSSSNDAFIPNNASKILNSQDEAELKKIKEDLNNTDLETSDIESISTELDKTDLSNL